MARGAGKMQLADAVRRVMPRSAKSAVRDMISSSAMESTVRFIFGDKIPHYGCSIPLPKDISGKAALIFFRLYERTEMKMIRKFLPTDLPVVELGASVGVISCQIGRRITPQKLISVEADPGLSDHVETVLATNRVDNATVVCGAVDYGPSPFVQFARTGNHLSGHVGSDQNSIPVPQVRLSDLLTRFDIEEYVLVSDVEGAEASILLKDRGALTKCRMILIEMHNTTFEGRLYTPKDISDLICQQDFRQIYRYGPYGAFSR
jgi:FkbM family methyltransferase